MCRQTVLPHPVLDLGLFRVRGFAGGVTVNVLGNVGLYGFLFMLTQDLQPVVDLDPMSAGLPMVPGLALTVLAGFVAVRAVGRFAARTVITAGMLLSAAGFLVVAVLDHSADAGPVAAPPALCLVGAGIGLAETLFNDLVLSVPPPRTAGAVSAISETGYETGADLGTAAVGGLLTAVYQRHLDLPAALGGVPRRAAGTYAGPGGAARPLGTEGEVVMTPQEMFEDAARRPFQVAEHVLEGISAEVLHTMPGGTANSVAWLVWHAARQQDAQVAELAGAEQAWTAEGWSERFGLDLPDASMGFGHTPEDVARIRVASPGLLRDYLGAVVERAVTYVRGLTDAQLDDVVDRSWTPHVTRGVRLVSTVDDAAQHLGQAAYVRGLLDDGWSGPY